MKALGRNLIMLIFVFALCFFTQTVFAEDNAGQKKEQKEQKSDQTKDKHGSYSLDEITVSGKGVTEPVTSPYSVMESSKLQTEVITREEIEALHPQTLWDVIEQYPGMEVTFQGRQHLDYSNMRGTENYGIILDGVYVTNVDRVLATLPVDAIESMTIVRDATALTLGPLTNFGPGTGSSNQGFAVIKTKRASKLEGGLVTSYGSFHTEKGHLYQGAKIGNFDYRIAGTYNSTLGKTNWYNASRNESLLFRGGYTGPEFNGDVLYYTSRGMREIQRGEILIPPTVKVKKGGKTITYLDYSQVGTLDSSKWKMDPMISDMIAVNLSKPWSDMQTTTFSYAYNSFLVSMMTTNFPDGSSKLGTSEQDHRGQSASLRHVITSRNNILKLGGQWNDYVEVWPGSRKDEDMFGLYVQDEYHMLNDRLTVDAGIRADKKYYSNSPAASGANPLTSKPVHEWAKETYAYALGASYKLNPIITLTGRYAYTENAQASYQVSADNSTLPPERRSRFEAGILANIRPFFNPSLTLYYYDTKNQKVGTTGIDPNTGKPASYYIDPATGEEIDFVTTDDVRTKGAEFGIYGQILKPFTYHLWYTYVETDNHTTNTEIPHHRVSARFSYQYKNAFANLSFRYVSSHHYTVYYELGNYTRVDANVGYNTKIFDRDTRITLYCRNLGNDAYATRYVRGAYYDPGRQYGIELAYSFF